MTLSARRRLAALMATSQAAPDLVFPTGTGPLPWSLATLPDGWIWADGATLLSGTPYTALRAAYIAAGFPYGQDGSGNPKVPDMRGRVPGGRDDLGGSAAGRLTVSLTGTRASTSSGVITGLSSTAGLSIGMVASGTGIGAGAVINSIDSGTQVTLSVNSSSTGSGVITFTALSGTGLGANGGAQVHALSTPQMPAHTHAAGAVISGRNTSTGGGESIVYQGSTNLSTSTGGGQAHPNIQPTLVVNYIVKT